MVEASARKATKEAGVALMQLAEQTTAERETLTGYVLTKNEVPDFVTFLESFVTDERVQLDILGLNEAVSPKDQTMGSLVVTMELLGSRTDVKRVLEMIELVPYHSYVSSIVIAESYDPQVGQTLWRSDVTLELTLTQ